MVVAVALLVVAALLVAPAAARTSITDIQPDDTIFKWETGLNLSALNTNGTVTSLKKLDDTTVINSITVTNATNFAVPTYLSGDDFGTYYAFNGTNKGSSIIIETPVLELDVVLVDPNHASSVNGRSLSEDTNIAFKIKALKAGESLANLDYANISVIVTPEGGAPLLTFGGAELEALPLVGSTMYTDTDFDDPFGGMVDLNQEDPGSYSAIAEWARPAGFHNFAPDSNSVTFTIRTQEVTIESDKDTVVRGNDFTVTVSGDSKTNYFVYVESEEIDDEDYPVIRAGQQNVNLSASLPTCVNDAANVTGTFARILTDAAGQKKVLLETDTDTDDRTFTIKVVSEDCADDDTVKVSIEKGAISVVAEGDQSYFLGEEVTLSGTNTDSDKVFLFITGPNLASAGGYLLNPDEAVDTGDEAAWKDADNGSFASVDSNDEWDLDWDTSELDLDAGTYTIYAVSEPANKDDLADVEYDSVSVSIKKPFVTAGSTSDVVAIGDDITLTGTAEGDPNNVIIWILGKNYYDQFSATIEDDGTFEEDISTVNLASGQYFVVVQHPMYNGKFDVTEQSCDQIASGKLCAVDGVSGDDIFALTGSGALQGSDAAQALVDALDSPYIDDTYTKLDFLVEEPWITIDSIGDKYVGDVFTLTGETNLAEGDEILVEVVSASFQPTEKTASGEFSGVSGTTEVVAGEDFNAWSFEVDASTFKPDEYIVRVEAVEADYTATTTFDVLAGVPPTTAPPTTEPPETTPPTTAPPTTAEPTPTPTPGFGALIALIGLGAVAVLVVRKH
ncbi:MAG: MEMAR_RS02690 family S-layer glycoprotein [Methanomicrobiaceae archaeon]|nr:MEMAR_RS02690 family S-layer glycoprotein [Methanomicrobiaceae archaeon]